MAYWKFICTWETERECFARRLFGNNKKEDPDGNLLNVEEGDTLFLHRTRNAQKRSGFLLGPFVARSDAQMNIVENAWNHRGDFPWQVRIGWNNTVYSLDVESVYEQSDSVPIDLTAHAQSVSDLNGTYLEGRVKKGDPIITALDKD